MTFFRLDSIDGRDLLIILPFIHILFDPTDPLSIISAILALMPHGLTLVYAILTTISWNCSAVLENNPYDSSRPLPSPDHDLEEDSILYRSESAFCHPILTSSTNHKTLCLLFLGQVISMIINWALKRMIKQRRPSELPGKEEYGMPSSHAQYLAWWSMSMTVFAFTFATGFVESLMGETAAAGPKYDSASVYFWAWIVKIAVVVFTQSLAGAVCWSRLYIGYHSREQVIAGTAVGATMSLAWWSLVMETNNVGWEWVW